jgi:PAB1-binding protein PBP1
LQAWQPGPDGTSPPPAQFGDDLTFEPNNTGNKTWDQFAANEQLYGVKTSFDEDAYTTKLDRSGADFKERERKAQRLANEIIGVRFLLHNIIGSSS